MKIDSRTKNWRLCVQCCIDCRRTYQSEASMANLSCPYSTGSGENDTIDVSGIEGVRWTGICLVADVMCGCGSILNGYFDDSYAGFWRHLTYIEVYITDRWCQFGRQLCKRCILQIFLVQSMAIMLWKTWNAAEAKLKKPHQEIDEAFLCLVLCPTSEPCQALSLLTSF